MNLVDTAVSRPATEDLIKFITEYRNLEARETQYGKRVIRTIFTKTQTEITRNYIADQWEAKEKDFGNFFLNKLSKRNRLILLNHWGIIDPEDKDYLSKCEGDRTFMFFTDPPKTTLQITAMMTFFECHGINKVPTPGITLEQLPPADFRYGISANWGRYVLSLEKPEIFFDNLFKHINEQG